jgi:hypothetical protein
VAERPRGCTVKRRFKAHEGRGCCSCGEATVSARRVAIIGGEAAPSFSQPTEVQSRPSGSAPLPVQAKRGLPGLLHCDLLSPRAHERGGPRVACVALERIAPEEGPSATHTDRLLGDRDYRALHGDVRRPGALDRLQRSIDLGLRDCSVVERARADSIAKSISAIA